jgi:hypothetical protein
MARIKEGTILRLFGIVSSYTVGESARDPGTVEITQFGSSLGNYTPTQARKLASILVSAANAIEGRDPESATRIARDIVGG